MPLAENIDFCYLALAGPHLDTSGTETPLPGLTVGDSIAPIELDDFWEGQLGEDSDAFLQGELSCD
jgi:hypothetical protein